MKRLKELLNIGPNDATKEDNDALTEELKTAQLIMPIEITSNINLEDIEAGDIIEFDEGLRFKPIKIVNDKGEVFIPLYSDDEQIPEPTSSIDIYTKNLAEMIGDNPENINGVVINPFSNYSVELEMDSFLNLFESED